MFIVEIIDMWLNVYITDEIELSVHGLQSYTGSLFLYFMKTEASAYSPVIDSF